MHLHDVLRIVKLVRKGIVVAARGRGEASTGRSCLVGITGLELHMHKMRRIIGMDVQKERTEHP